MKRIVFDFDDTLSHVKKPRDWDNAIPNDRLVQKMRSLKEQGWQLDIYTARGSLSCKTRKEADKKYRVSIEAWLAKYQVPYDSLSFDKPLATYYVDDKAMTPEDFVATHITHLNGGLSGAEIYTDGRSVFKEDKNAFEVNSWYEKAKSIGLTVPSVQRVIGDTITMDYIDHLPNYFYDNTSRALGIIFEKMELMAKQSHQCKWSFGDYCDNIRKHLEESSGALNPELYSRLITIGSNVHDGMFFHGDFSVSNLLFTSDNDLYLIDPIPHKYGSIHIDAAKLLAPILIFKQEWMSIYGYTKRMLKAACHISEDTLQILIACEIARVYKYSNNKDAVKKAFNYVFK